LNLASDQGTLRWMKYQLCKESACDVEESMSTIRAWGVGDTQRFLSSSTPEIKNLWVPRDKCVHILLPNKVFVTLEPYSFPIQSLWANEPNLLTWISSLTTTTGFMLSLP
jgi:hypothetical protein